MDSEVRKERRNPEKEKFWRDTMKERAGSGKSVREFCAEKGMKLNLFYEWRRELKLRDREAAGKGGFVEIVRTRPVGGQAGVSIRVDERLSIVVDRGFDGETLRAAMACVCAMAGTR